MEQWEKEWREFYENDEIRGTPSMKLPVAPEEEL